MKKIYPLAPGVTKSQNLIKFLEIFRKRNFMFQKTAMLFLSCILLAGMSNKLYADVDVTTSAVAAGSINQGTNNNVIYIARMDVTVSAVTVNNVQFTLSGTHDANDLSTVLVYFNSTNPVFAGSSFLGSATATFAAPHTYSITVSRAMAAGSTGYFIIVANVNSDATDNNTVKINGATNPMVFGFTIAPAITNHQSDLAGVQTIEAADITVTSTAVVAGDINQGTNNNVIYIAQMSVSTEPVNVNNVQFTLSGTHDANDLSTVLVYFNGTNPVFTGSSFLGSATATFAAPHTYSINVSRAMAAGSTGYFIIVANVNSDATDNNTVKINGATNPMVFGFTTEPNITNTQSDIAGVQTIQGADITVTSTAVVAGDINQGTNNNVIYIAQMSVSTEPVNVNNVQFTLSGTHDANDLSTVLVYFNGTNPVFTGSSFLGSATATFAAPHTYSINVSRAMATGSTGYFIIVANVNSDATDNNTVKINGATNPMVFGFTTEPNITNTQSDIAGVQTIQGADITVTSTAVVAGDINQGTNNNVIYIAQMSVSTEPVNVNNVQFTLSGTHDANDLSTVLVYFNGTNPVFTGSSFLGSATATFAAPHTYSINVSRAMATGSTGYFIIVANVNSDATDNNTVKINGATNPMVFGFTTEPNITNTQSDIAGVQTIQGADITVTSTAVVAGDINQGTNNNVIYIAQMSVSTEPVNVNNVQFTLSGTHDANDLSTVLVYFNGTNPVFTGSSFLGSATATFAAPHTYSINVSRAMAAGSTGYFIIVANVNSDATDNNTLKINGATNPMVFGFTTEPNITNTQSDIAGIQTIQASDITIATSPVAGNTFAPGTNNNVIYIAQMSVATEPVNVNNVQFTLSGTHDANDLSTVLVYFNSANPVFAGSSFLGSATATFAAPHTYSINVSRAMAVGSMGYFIILVNTSAGATVGNTVKIDGLVNPVVFGFTTAPNITSNQDDNGGLHVLPISFINIRAYEKDGVNVEWKVTNELNIASYFVERSADGSVFSSIGQTNATGSGLSTSIYTMPDAKPFTGNNFYRINALTKDGKTELSPVVKINLNKNSRGISVYPNPVLRNGALNLQFQNLNKGSYILSIFNQQGQQVLHKIITHDGGNSVQPILLPKIAAGLYLVEARNEDTKYVNTIMVE